MKVTKNNIKNNSSAFLIFLSLVGYIFFKNLYPTICSYFRNTLGIYKLPKINEQIFIIIIFLILIFNMIFWCITNSINKGIKYAITHYRLNKDIEKQLIFIDYDIKESKRFIVLPKIKIEFKDENLMNCEIRIQNLVRYDKNLETIRLNSSLGSYFLTGKQYISQDGNWYIFNCKNIKAMEQIEFKDMKEYLKWCKCDNYKYKISQTDFLDITHCAISGQTGSGKTYYLQSILLQLINKDIKTDIKIIDPKHADLYYFGIRNLTENSVGDKNKAIEMINIFYKEMLERQEILYNFFKKNPNSDYRKAGLEAKILVIDEFGSLRNSFKNLPKAQRDGIDEKLSDIAFIGRQLGCFLWIATQQFNYQIIPTQLTEQMSTKIVLGNSDEQTYRNLFSQSVNIPNINLKPGYGYFAYPNITTVQNPMLFVSPYCRFLSDPSA
ncbi:FtsK/SpoIIIE family protein [Anaerococcus hydrogenalis]|nr:FtsK/SpoIIIE family protein [Anaerococcus hydrogenalis]